MDSQVLIQSFRNYFQQNQLKVYLTEFRKLRGLIGKKNVSLQEEECARDMVSNERGLS